MNRLLSLLLVSLLTLVVCTRILSRPTSDEETVKNLEIEWAKHSGLGESDIAFQKTIMVDYLVIIDPVGHIYDQTPADFEKITVEMRTKNPDAKVTNEINDIKVRVSGNIATVTHSGTYTATGFKDPNANVPGAHYVAVDTWQKQSGKWKVIAGAAVSTEPIPAEVYKSPAPGSN